MVSCIFAKQFVHCVLITFSRYLIGQRLVNYNGGESNQPTTQSKPSRNRN